MIKNVLLTGNNQNIFPIVQDEDQIYHKGRVLTSAVLELRKEIMSTIYPVGSVLILENEINPNDLVQGVYWEAYSSGRILVGQGYLNNDTSSTFIDPSSTNKPKGEYSVALTTSTIPAHTHGLYPVARATGTQGYDIKGSGSEAYTLYNGGGGSHPNMMPYKVVNFWKRVAEQPKGAALNTFSWGQIKQIAKEGQASEYWSIGDTKLVYTATNVFTFRIVDFRNEQITEDGNISSGIVFEMVETIKPNISYNHGIVTFNSSTLNSYFQDVLIPSLPKDLIKSITSVYKNNIYIDTSSGQDVFLKEKMSLWLASATERGASSLDPINEDQVFSYYQDVPLSSSVRNKIFLWDKTLASYQEMLRFSRIASSPTSAGAVNLTTHSISGETKNGVIATSTISVSNYLSLENTYHIAPCFFIGGEQ